MLSIFLIIIYFANSAERRLNDLESKRRLGEYVKFGDIVELEHVKSGRRLSILDRQVAQIDRGNLKVILQKKPSEACWLCISARSVHCSGIDGSFKVIAHIAFFSIGIAPNWKETEFARTLLLPFTLSNLA